MKYGEMVRAVWSRAGFDVAQVQAQERALVYEALAQALEFGWSLFGWPEIMEVVAVEPRLAVDGAGQGPLLAGATAEQLASGRAWYVDGGDFERGTIEGITMRHPWLGAQDLKALRWREVGGRVLLLSADGRGNAPVAGEVVYVEQRMPCPQWRVLEWSDAATYAPGDVVVHAYPVVYGSGVWRCVTATSAGESPVSAAAKWVEQVVPVVFGRFAVEYAAAVWALQDGQVDREMVREQKAVSYLYPEKDRVSYRHGGPVSKYAVSG
jgi:hypothetical protein